MEEIFMLFFDSVSGDKIAFKNLNRYSIVLGFEVANSVLAHLAPVLHLKVHFQNFVSSRRTNKQNIALDMAQRQYIVA